MSADNYYVIRKDSGGKFVPVMGFASDHYDGDDYGEPQIEARHEPRFDTVEQAMHWAMDEYTEYGVRVHPECEWKP